MLYSTGEVGIRVYHMASFLITTATKKARRWHRLRCYMVVGAKHYCFGMRLEKDKFLVPKFYGMPGDKSIPEDCTIKEEELCRS
jgi:hypothetical protein